MTLSCPICLDKIRDSEVAALSCGHIFDRKCIRECLTNRRVCPICNAPYNDRCGIIPLFLNTDEETDTLILDLQRELTKKSDKIERSNVIITKLKNEFSNCKNIIDRKEKEYSTLQNNYNIVRMEIESKVTALNTSNNNCAIFKSERDEKVKAVSALEGKLKEISQNSCDLDKYNESRTKYQALLNKFEKAVDEKVSVKQTMESLQEKVTAMERENASSTSSNELVNQIEKLKLENQSLKSKTEDKNRYNKLLESFERLVDERTSTAHEHQKKIEEYEKLLREKKSHEDDNQIKKEFADCQLELESINLNLSTSLTKNKELIEQNKKSKEITSKLRKEIKDLRQENANMKIGNGKLIAQKNKAYSDLEKLKKRSGTKTESVTNSVVNLGISSATGDNTTTDSEKEFNELKTTRNRLLRKVDSLAIRNNELQAQVIKLKQNVEDLKSDQAGSETISKAKLKELKHHCDGLTAIINLITE